MTQWIQFDTAEDVALAAADTIEEHARHAIQQRGEFKIVLAGGTTPVACYKLLAQRELEWDKWKLFYGDERCLPLHDRERNHQMVVASGLIDHVRQHFIIPAEKDADSAATIYQSLIIDQMPFDLVLLGMGEDGHTASLFPGQPWDEIDQGKLVISVKHSPKPPPHRVSLALQTLQNCLQMLVLVTGESKREALKLWLQGDSLPVARVANIEKAAVYVEKSLMV
jgi:6-phosphogluconolactonase